MSVVAAVATVVAAGASVASGIQQRKEAKRAQREQKRAQDIENRRQQIEYQRRLRQAQAEARVKQAQVLAQEGGMASSTAAGQASGIATNLGGAIGFGQTQSAAAYGISKAQDAYSRHMLKAQHNVWGDVSTISGAIGSAAGGYAAQGGTWSSFKDLFSFGGGGGDSGFSSFGSEGLRRAMT